MTHDEITALQAEYAGSSRRPGKFQGESDWAAYYWDKVMDGCEDDRQYDPDDDTPISIFRVDNEDRLIFPELEDMVEVWLWEDDQGFVGTRTFKIGEDIPSWDDVNPIAMTYRKQHWLCFWVQVSANRIDATQRL